MYRLHFDNNLIHTPDDDLNYWNEKAIKAAIVQYNQEQNNVSRSKLYNDVLKKPIEKMASIIWIKYFRKRNIDLQPIESDIIKDSVSNLFLGAFTQFSIDKNAFSYFQTCVKNYFHSVADRNNLLKERQSVTYFLDDDIDFVEADKECYQQLAIDSLTKDDVIDFIEKKVEVCEDIKDRLVLLEIVRYLEETIDLNDRSFFRHLSATFGNSFIKYFWYRNFGNYKDYVMSRNKESRVDKDGYKSPDGWFWDVNLKTELKNLKAKKSAKNGRQRKAYEQQKNKKQK
jgi:hypothetical protein